MDPSKKSAEKLYRQGGKKKGGRGRLEIKEAQPCHTNEDRDRTWRDI